MFRRKKVDERREILLQAFYNLEDKLTSKLDPADAIVAFTATDDKTNKINTILVMGGHLAEENERILVIDANLRADELEEMKGYYNKRGFVDCLLGDYALDEVLVKENDNLHLLMTGRVADYEDMYLEPSAIKSFFDEAMVKYDYIFVNTKENIDIAEANVFCGLADKTVILTNEEATRTYLLEESVDQLESTGAKILGVVVTDYEYQSDELDDLFGGN
ncbi:protein tyrosine kinase [Anaerococcus sp. NML200574]|uniref:protein tyrosine kinase n=1 Tax=unclassified Anaerococcus TaxID=2614126 RepID=UPI000D0AF272|nr:MULTISPECIES: protein tyrosine kinase [unclassified Anaerococcus]MCW6679077.1 protein tyrosine kinase [Anaerococcus sp. NML200574]MCW6701485.1 protein tyrosine kinase [Anaerococcus sp. NML200537]